jgi:thioredoxin 2
VAFSEAKSLTICNHCNATNRIDVDRARTKIPVCGKCGEKLSFHSFISDLGLEQLEKLISRADDKKIVVDFWAPWCSPCLSFAPTFERVAARNAEDVIFVKIDTEANPDASTAFRIQSIPTLLVFRGGAERARQSGAMQESAFEDWLVNSARF